MSVWATLKCEDPEDVDAGHRYAPDEKEILVTVVTYIHIGNEDIHSDRTLINRKHKTYYFDWLISRGKHPEQNRIYVWNNLL